MISAYDKTQATTFSLMECLFLEAPKMYQENIHVLPKQYLIYSYLQRHLSFCKARKSNFISPYHTYTKTMNRKDTLLNTKFQSTFKFEGQHSNNNYSFQITPVHQTPKYRTRKVNFTIPLRQPKEFDQHFFVPLMQFALDMAGHRNHLGAFKN